MLTPNCSLKTPGRITAFLRNKIACAAGLAGALLIGMTAPAHSAATIRLMPLGDAITAGFQSSDQNGDRQTLYNDSKGAGNLTDFVGSLRDGNAFDPDHEGHSGYEISQVAALLDGVLATYQPNLVTLHIGTNRSTIETVAWSWTCPVSRRRRRRSSINTAGTPAPTRSSTCFRDNRSRPSPLLAGRQPGCKLCQTVAFARHCLATGGSTGSGRSRA